MKQALLKQLSDTQSLTYSKSHYTNNEMENKFINTKESIFYIVQPMVNLYDAVVNLQQSVDASDFWYIDK